MFAIRLFFFLGFALWIYQERGAVATEANKVVPVFTLPSTTYPLRVVSRDFQLNQELLEIGEDTVGSFVKILGLEGVPFKRCTLRWRPLAGAPEPVQEMFPHPFSYPRSISMEGGRALLKIEMEGPMAGGQIPIRRSLIIALLQAVAWDGEDEISLAELPEPPVWLVEGILWEMLRYRDAAWREIVLKAGRTQKTPSLQEIQSWEELSTLEFERAWMQAFSFTLFRHAFKNQAEKKALRLWLREFRFPAPRHFWVQDDSVQNWWMETVEEPLPDRLPILSWSSTVASLNQLRNRSLRLIEMEKEEDGPPEPERRLLQFNELPWNYRPAYPQEVEEWLRELGLLASQSHFAWRSIIAGYIQALDLWAKGGEKREEAYQSLVQSLQARERQIVQRQTRAEEMLDWAVVNLDFGVEQDRFSGYARLVRELEDERRRFRDEFGKQKEEEMTDE